MKAISFSLWGHDPRYLQGMLANILLARHHYPSWQVHIYTDGTSVDAECKSLGAIIHASTIPNAMFWRFEAIDLPGCERMLVRDADSRLSAREAKATEAWEASHAPFYVIRDHPHHTPPMGGGLWGMSKYGPNSPSMRQLIDAWPASQMRGSRDTIYHSDQLFLAAAVWPMARSLGCFELDFCNRHLYPSAQPFPASLGDWRFVGERFDAEGNPEADKWASRLNYMVLDGGAPP